MRKVRYVAVAVAGMVVFVVFVWIALANPPVDVYAWLDTPVKTTAVKTTEPPASETPPPTAERSPEPTPSSPPEWTASPGPDGTVTPVGEPTPTPTGVVTRTPGVTPDPTASQTPGATATPGKNKRPTPTWDCREYNPEECLAPTGLGDFPYNVRLGLIGIGGVLLVAVAWAARRARHA